jgi:[acyl-carrier-protein] S-malonyltransferase
MEASGMGLSVADASPAARGLLELASELTGEDLPRLLRRGGRALQRTEVLQPCLTAVALGAVEALLAAGVRPEIVAGHSLGEVAAGVAAGCLAPPAAVKLARLRGMLMAREAARSPGGMLALLEIDQAAVEGALARHSVDLAAHNAPGEWVVSGALHELRELARDLPARLLPVSGAWHGRAMAGVVPELEKALSAVCPETTGAVRVICNATGEEVAVEHFLSQLAAQLTRPVLWAGTMTTLATAGVTDVVTVGPGHVLRGLLRKNLDQAIRVHTTEDARDLARTAEILTT